MTNQNETFGRLLRGAINSIAAYEGKTAAAIEATQRELQVEAWPTSVLLKVRMALHIGAAQQRDGDYFGPPLNRVARLCSAGVRSAVLLAATTLRFRSDGTRSVDPPAGGNHSR
jgi:class 3 adenylate cyclase